MSDLLLAAPIAFLSYLVLVGILSGVGRVLAGPSRAAALKGDAYAGGEAPPLRPAAPGYAPFFAIALFFAVLHLGVLVLASGGLAPVTGVYLAGLLLALGALILG